MDFAYLSLNMKLKESERSAKSEHSARTSYKSTLAPHSVDDVLCSAFCCKLPLN